MDNKEIQSTLDNMDIPKSLSLDGHTEVGDTSIFVSTHLTILNNEEMSDKVKEPYRRRLIKLITILQ